MRIKKGDSILIPFSQGVFRTDASLRMRAYESREHYETYKNRYPKLCRLDEELVEYAPVNRSTWEKIGELKVRCPVCKTEYKLYHPYQYLFWKYCSQCGTKMERNESYEEKRL